MNIITGCFGILWFIPPFGAATHHPVITSIFMGFMIISISLLSFMTILNEELYQDARERRFELLRMYEELRKSYFALRMRELSHRCEQKQ
jgi:hypothetical protein